MDGKQDIVRYLPQNLASFPTFLMMRDTKHLQLLAMPAQHSSRLLSLQACPWVTVKFLKGMVSLPCPPTFSSD